MDKLARGQINRAWRAGPHRFVLVEGDGRKRLIDTLDSVTQPAVRHAQHDKKASRSTEAKRRAIATRRPSQRSRSTSDDGTASTGAVTSTSESSEDETLEGKSHHLNADSLIAPLSEVPARMLLCSAYPSDLPTEVVAPVFHLWNTLATAILGSASGSVQAQIGQHLIANPGPFHTGLMNALEAQSVALIPSEKQRNVALQQLCHSIGIEKARIMVTDYNTDAKQPPIDAFLPLLIMTLALATQATEEPPSFRQRRHPGPIQAPFRSLGMLDVWGSGYRFRNMHTDAMYRLLALAGGLDAFPPWACVLPSM